MLRFRLFNIPFAVTPFFWIGSAIFGSNAARGEHALLFLAIWVACVFVSIVLHELGHALAGRHFGLSPYVELYQMGGLTFLPGGALSRAQHICVSLAGPAAGFFGYLCVHAVNYGLRTTSLGALADSGPMTGLIVREALWDLDHINGYWTLVNLLPILPLDGGQVLRDVLGPRWRAATRSSGGACAVVCALLTYQNGQPILALFLGYLAFLNFRGEANSLTGGTATGNR